MRDQLLQSKAGLDYYSKLSGKPSPFKDSDFPQPREPRPRQKDLIDAVPELSELQHQIRVISWWEDAHDLYGLPVFALFAIPNGGSRGTVEAANFKRSGVRAGIYDLCLASARQGSHGLYIELKKGKGKPSPEQIEVGRYFDSAGYRTSVQWTHEGAIAVIRNYLQMH